MVISINEERSALIADVNNQFFVSENISIFTPFLPLFSGITKPGGFETGDFTGYSTIGNTSIQTAAFGSVPSQGIFDALLRTDAGAVSASVLESSLGLSPGDLSGFGATEGSAIHQTFLATAGQVLSFDWNFLTDEFTPDFTFNDLSLVTIDDGSTSFLDFGSILADTFFSSFGPSATPFFQETGFNSFSYIIPTTGTYTLGFAVTDVGDTLFSSGLLVDNILLANPLLINGDFETGDFTGYSTIGNTSIQTAAFGSGPSLGSFDALLTTDAGAVSASVLESSLGLFPGDLSSSFGATEGSAIHQTFLATAGQTLSFDWNFLTNESTPSLNFNDFSLVTIDDGSTPFLDFGSILADTFSLLGSHGAPFFQETGFNSFSYIIPTTGTYTLGFAVTDVGDTFVSSGLLVDNISLV